MPAEHSGMARDPDRRPARRLSTRAGARLAVRDDRGNQPDEARAAGPPGDAGDARRATGDPAALDASGAAAVDDLVRRIFAGEDDSGLRRQITRLMAALASSARGAGTFAVTGGRWLADVVIDVAPNLQIRDLATLEGAYDGRTGDELADALVKSAARRTAAIGAAGGALAAAEIVAPPTLFGVPLQLAAETLLVVAVELRLVGELHVVYGRALPDSARARASALVTAWIRRRGIDPLAGGVAGALGGAARRELRTRVLRRLRGNLTTLAPFLAGAVAGAEVNRRETNALAERILADLRRR